MKSFSFPNMLSINRVNMVEGKDATASNLVLLLGAEKKGLFGDPYFGTLLKKMIYSQNDNILRDIVIDEIYTSIITFMPQVRLSRKDIKLTLDKTSLLVNIKCINILDGDKQDFTLRLFSDGE